jgi:hypothetical protein
MDKHPKITTFLHKEDASYVLSLSDIVISFPFTSTTFEALSVDKPAIWHDPLGHYTDTPYGRMKGVTTKGYDELKRRILEIIKMKSATFQNPIPPNSPLMDPYRDGKAIERFRQLLTSEYNGE